MRQISFARTVSAVAIAALLAACSGGNATNPPLPMGATSEAPQASSASGASSLRYKLVDLGTFGGPSSFFVFSNHVLNNSGVATGAAETTLPDPLCFDPECLISNTFEWKGGTLTQLLPAPGDTADGPNYISDSGAIAGVSLRPIPNFFTFDAVIWKNGTVVKLGTFGGDFGYAAAINNGAQATGFATNTVPDALPLGNFCQNFPIGAQMRAFIWKAGTLRDLGTLGGPDSCGLWINDSGDVAGLSFVNSTINATTGVPTVEPFIWKNGKMTDIGSLGGTIGMVAQINSRGDVAGTSNLGGDTTFHPFLWNRGTLTDLGTLGGNNGEANWLNDVGDVVGAADLPGSAVHDAFLWKNGVIKNLGTQDGDPCSRALSVNSKGEIVGGSSDCQNFLHAFVIEPGGPMVDLNGFVPAGSDVTLTEAVAINERGEIAVQAVRADGSARAMLLIPCGAGQAGCIVATASKLRRAEVAAHPNARYKAVGSHGALDDRYRIAGALQRSRK